MSNYWTLSDEAKKRGIDVSEIAGETAVIAFSDDDANDDAILYFTDSDRAMVDSLPEKLTTEQYVLVVTLLDKLEGVKILTVKTHISESLFRQRSKLPRFRRK